MSSDGERSRPGGEAFGEDDLVPLSALQHLVFCERQAALIHVEQVWADSAATIEGSALHETVDAGDSGSRRGVRVARGLALRSLRLGVAGRADVVEFHPVADIDSGVELPGIQGRRFIPFPIEYKRGRPKRHRADEVQLCAQAVCLEEMLGVSVPEGALFYARIRHRAGVTFDADLRRLTERSAARMHEILRLGMTPAAVWGRRCRECSLLEICRPRAPARSARRYIESLFETSRSVRSEPWT